MTRGGRIKTRTIKNGAPREDHDQIFKTVVREFFREFAELFLPEESKRIDFSRVEFLDKEMFGDRLRGTRRQLDLVAKVGLLDGGAEFVLVHVEFESDKPDTGFPERMFRYFCHLYIRHGLPVIPVVLFTDDAQWSPKDVPNHFDISLGGGMAGVHFKFARFKLRAISYRKFLRKGNPLAYALMAKMNYDRKQIARFKADFLRLMLGCKIDEARKSLLFEFIDHYMVLNDSQQSEFDSLVHDENQDDGEVLNMITSFEKRAMQQGIQQGILQKAQESLLDILEARFSRVPKTLQKQIAGIDDHQRLRDLHRKAITIPKIGDLAL